MRRPATKVSPVEIARLALSDVSAGVPSPWRDEVVALAALLWCRGLAIPSVRALAAALGRAPSEVLRPFGGVVELYAEVIRCEWAVLDGGWFAAHPKARAGCFRAHVVELRTRDPALLRLPGLVLGAVTGAGRRVPAGLAVPWYSLAAFADDGSVVIDRLSA